MSDTEKEALIDTSETSLKLLEDDAISVKEVALINEVYDLVINSGGFIKSEDIKESILKKFNENSKKVLNNEASPLNIALDTSCKQTQIKGAMIGYFVSKMLYTQAQGDDLSLAAANYGITRIEAKSSTMMISLTTDKEVILSQGTSFADGAGTIWLLNKETKLPKNTPTRVLLESREKGVINFITPLNPTNTIAGLVNIEVDSTSIVVGKNQESDTALRETIANGINIKDGDSACKRDLLALQMVNSAFVITNPFTRDVVQTGVTINPRMRYVSVRLSNPNISNEEADLIAQTITLNSNYNPNFQIPTDKKVKAFFGIAEDKLTKPIEQGGAGLAGVDVNSNCILVRTNEIYGNFIDVYFYIAKPTNVDVLLTLSYRDNLSNVGKENLNGKIKQAIAQIISETAQVGTSLLTSTITARYSDTELKEQASIVQCWVRRHDTKDQFQNLDANSNEYFQLFDDPAKPYAGVVLTEANN